MSRELSCIFVQCDDCDTILKHSISLHENLEDMVIYVTPCKCVRENNDERATKKDKQIVNQSI